MEGDNPNLYPKESLVKRYKLIWRLLMISNLGLGAYMFVRARMKNLEMADSKKAPVKDTPPKREEPFESETIPPIPETPAPPPVAIIPKEPLTEDQQRELFKWILEEKRKTKPEGREEKKQIDEEKAILKQFIRAESIPRL